MIYDFLGKKMTGEEVHNELLMNPKLDLTSAYVYLRTQRKINAERRIEKEKDPDRKRLMKELYSQGMYNFDAFFGKE